MSWGDFLIVFGCCAVTMLACRVIPLFALKGRSLPEGVERALGFIPPAAFAALVANGLLTPGILAAASSTAALQCPQRIPFTFSTGMSASRVSVFIGY